MRFALAALLLAAGCADCATPSSVVPHTYDGTIAVSAIGESSGLVIATSESWQEGEGNMYLVAQYSHPSPGVCEPLIVNVVRMLGGTKHWKDGVLVELRAGGNALVTGKASYEQTGKTLGVEETLTIAPVESAPLEAFFAAPDAVIVVAGEPHGLPASMRAVGQQLIERHRACK